MPLIKKLSAKKMNNFFVPACKNGDYPLKLEKKPEN